MQTSLKVGRHFSVHSVFLHVILCFILIADPEFKYIFTANTNPLEDLSRQTKNVLYGIECTFCGLNYDENTTETIETSQSAEIIHQQKCIEMCPPKFDNLI